MSNEQKNTKKTDESVKAGLQIEADTKPHNATDKNIPEAENEKDADELVHERTDVVADENAEQDADELVHLRNIDTATNVEDEEKDVDDLMHKGSL